MLIGVQLCMKQPPQSWSDERAVSQFRQYHIATEAHTFGRPTATHLMQFLIDACVLVCITIAMCGYNLLLTLEAAAYLKAMDERKFIQSQNCGQFIGNVSRVNQNLTTYSWANNWMWRQKIKNGHWSSMRIRSRTDYPIKIENKWFRTCRSSFRIPSNQMYPMQANETIAESMRTLNAHCDTRVGPQKAWRKQSKSPHTYVHRSTTLMCAPAEIAFIVNVHFQNFNSELWMNEKMSRNLRVHVTHNFICYKIANVTSSERGSVSKKRTHNSFVPSSKWDGKKEKETSVRSHMQAMK